MRLEECVVCTALVVLVLAGGVARAEDGEYTERARAIADAKLADPPLFSTRGGSVERIALGDVVVDVFYKLEVPSTESKGLVVLVDGIFEWLYRWDFLVPELLDKGFTVLRYDHVNRGHTVVVSEDKNPAQTKSLYVGLLHKLLEKRGLLAKPFRMVAHSMGGAVAISYAAEYPNTVSHLMLLSPAGFFTTLTAKVGKYALPAGMLANILKSGSSQAHLEDFYDPTHFGARYTLAMQAPMPEHRAHAYDSFVSTIKNFAQLFDASHEAQTVAASSTVVRVLLGEFDATVPVDQTLDGLLDNFAACANFGLEVVPNTKHCFFLENIEVSHAAILGFVAR